MKSVFFSALALTGILLSSCNKEVVAPTPVPANAKKHLVQQAFSGYYTDTVNYEYDVQGRVIKAGYPEDVYTLVYNGNSISVKDFRPLENRLVLDATATLDANKRVVKLNGNAAYVANSPYTTEYVYTYGQAGELLSVTDTRSNGNVIKKVYTWTNGDITRFDVWINGVLKYYITYEYFNLEDITGIDLYRFECAVTDIIGVNSKHLVKKSTTSYADSTPSFSVDFMYTLDSQGYPVKLESKNSFGDVSKVVYKYDK
ncbi:DUF4595 domain-containing protein [Ferruginibacter sp. HRS2-29]|uniref:DUF4595 domain-containing protein n=1 Tax=Ferruginibacter sp. HRS2-29 TaxID=2487334 RepID=UPI0020CEC933|nr:DUF4595 domain-containing protein [Ferruginibacter sp. HRS2-29]